MLRVALAVLSLSLPACSAPAASTSAAETPGETVESPEVAPAPRGKRAPCQSDQACNDDPSVSALWGRCTELGVCECNDGFERSPTSDLCRPRPSE